MLRHNQIDVSIILSIHNEELNLAPLITRIARVMNSYAHIDGWEVIMVNDASIDNSREVIKQLEDQFPQVVAVHHLERRGQKGCFMSGFEKARGPISILMDADLQVLPEELPLLLDKVIVEKYEIVCTYNDPKRGGKHRGWVSYIGNFFMKLLFNSPVKDAGANFMAIETRYIRGVRLVINDQRYLLPISMRRGLSKITEVGCIFSVRGYGKSKYSKLRKALLGIPEMFQLKQRLITGFYDSPPVPLKFSAPQAEQIQYLTKEALESILNQIPAQHHAALNSIVDNPSSRTFALFDGESAQSIISWQPLEWDSQMLGKNAGAIKFLWADGNYKIQVSHLKNLFNYCLEDATKHGVEFLSLRVEEENVGAIHSAEAAGFRVIESYITLEHTLEKIPEPDTRVRDARTEDREPAAEIAYRAFRHNRYIADPMLPEHLARQSRSEWVKNGFNGRSEAAYVAESEGLIRGFLLLKTASQSDGIKKGIIDLIAIDPDYSGQGLGSALVAQAVYHYAGKASSIEVGTQGKNIGAANLYIQNGFRFKRAELSLHWHRNYTGKD